MDLFASEERNSLLLLQHREGILSGYLRDDGLERAAHLSLLWSDEPRKGIEGLWRNEKGELEIPSGFGENLRFISILDSFFSDTLTNKDIRIPIFDRAFQGIPVKFLLADPLGPFGNSRASAIGQSSLYRSVEGFKNLALACNTVRLRRDPSWVSLEKEISPLRNEDEWADISRLLLKTIEGLPIEIRLYQDAPNCPLYFFSDLLIVGRFWVDSTAAHHPWEHIIDTPFPDDLYDIMLREFNAVWSSATSLSEVMNGKTLIPGSKVFISCSKSDEVLVNELKKGFKTEKIETFVFYNDIPPGKLWPLEVKEQIKASGALVAVVSDKAMENIDWICAEIGAAWVLGKHIIQANVANSPKILPGIMDKKWAVDVSSPEGRQSLVHSIKQMFLNR